MGGRAQRKKTDVTPLTAPAHPSTFVTYVTESGSDVLRRSKVTSRHHVRTRTTAVLGSLALATAAAGCSSSVANDSEGTIKVGVVWPFNGANSDYGPDGLAGAELALKQAGKKVGGRPVEIVKANEDVLDPSKTLTEVKRLVQQEGVSIMLGPVFGSSQQAVDSYLRTSGVMYFVPYGATKELGGTGHAISWPTLDTEFSTPLGDYLAKKLRYKSIATVGADYVYGHNVLSGATREFKKNGGKVAQQQWVPLGTTDLMPYASHLRKNVDALVMWLVPQDAATFVKDLRSLGVDIPIVFVNGIFDPTFQSIGSKIEGSLGVVDWSSALPNKANKRFVSAFRKSHDGKYPNTNNAAGYTDMQLALETVKKTKGSTAFEDMTTAVRQIRPNTIYGPGYLDKDYFGVTTRSIVKATKKDGRYIWQPVKTYRSVPNK